MREATLSLAARSSSVKESLVTPPSSCLPISPRSEILRHSRSPSITFLSHLPEGASSRATTILARRQGAGLIERAEQEVGAEPVRRDAVAAGYGAGREQGVQDRLLGRLRRRVEERRHELVRDHGEGHG